MTSAESIWRRWLKLSLAIVLCLGLGGTGCEPFKTQRSEQRKYAVKPGTTVEVWASDVSVSVNPGEPGRVELHTTKRTMAFLFSGRLQKNISIAVTAMDKRLLIKEVHPAEPRKYKVSLNLHVPPDSPVRLRLTSGSANFEQLQGPITVNIAGSGRVVSHDVAAPQTIRLGRGEVIVQHPRAPFQVLNRKGLIHLVLKDGVVLRGHSAAETHDGEIKLATAPNSQASYSVFAPAGGIRSDLPLHKSGKRMISGPTGPSPIRLTASKGTVTIHGAAK